MKCHDRLPGVKWHGLVGVALYMDFNGLNDFPREWMVKNVVVAFGDEIPLLHWNNPQEGNISITHEVWLNNVGVNKEIVETAKDICWVFRFDVTHIVRSRTVKTEHLTQKWGHGDIVSSMNAIVFCWQGVLADL